MRALVLLIVMRSMAFAGPAVATRAEIDNEEPPSQQARPGAEDESSGACVRGHAAPECEVVLLGELGFHRGTSTDDTLAPELSLSLQVGFLRNVGKHGFGMSAGLRGGDFFAGKMAHARYRYYTESGAALEAGLGVAWRRGGRDAYSPAGASATAALVLADYVSVVADATVFGGPAGPEIAVSGGVRIGFGILGPVIAALITSGAPRRPGWLGGTHK